MNFFAHTGAFSIATASAGTKTVSLDLNIKWLDRVRPKMEENGIMEWDGHNDIIYGDCFDCLARLVNKKEWSELQGQTTRVGGWS